MSLRGSLPQGEGPGEHYFLLYDGHCTICTVFARIVKGLDIDDRIMLLSLHDPVARKAAEGATLLQYLRAFHLVGPDSQVASGEDALPTLVSLFPAGQVAVGILNSVPGALMALEMLYRAAVRGRTVMLCGGRATGHLVSPPV
ncbi:MAG: thiol-disulfide oxidoreductase DCC family protein [Candidatus Geothermarchaeales archaeon]